LAHVVLGLIVQRKKHTDHVPDNVAQDRRDDQRVILLHDEPDGAPVEAGYRGGGKHADRHPTPHDGPRENDSSDVYHE